MCYASAPLACPYQAGAYGLGTSNPWAIYLFGYRIKPDVGIQIRLGELKVRGWTLAAIADELGMHWNTVKRWDKGSRSPDHRRPVLLALDVLFRRKRIPKQRRYTKGSRLRGSG